MYYTVMVAGKPPLGLSSCHKSPTKRTLMPPKGSTSPSHVNIRPYTVTLPQTKLALYSFKIYVICIDTIKLSDTTHIKTSPSPYYLSAQFCFYLYVFYSYPSFLKAIHCTNAQAVNVCYWLNCGKTKSAPLRFFYENKKNMSHLNIKTKICNEFSDWIWSWRAWEHSQLTMSLP